VADLSKTKKSTQMTEENINFYSAIDTGYISQNVYLYCASEGLATVVRGSFDKAALTKIMKLPETKKVIICQTVGYPAVNK
jgi:nitroreductase